MASLMPQGKQQYFDNNGDPLAGGKLYTYAAGTTTPLATYTTATGSVANANPVILDSRGEAAVFWGPNLYKVALKTSSDVEVWTQDNLKATPSAAVSLRDFANGDGIADDTAGLVTFLSEGGGEVPSGTYLIDDVTITNKVLVNCHPGATFKKKSSTSPSSILIKFAAGSEGSVWKGGIIDGDRSTHAAAYAAHFPTFGNYWGGWLGMKTQAAHITIRDVKFVNWVAKPFWFAGDYNVIEDIVAEDHGDACLFGWEWFGTNKYSSRPTGDGAYRQKVNNITSIRCDNNGIAAAIQHAIDLMACEEGEYTNLQVSDQDGDTSGVSTFASGITAEQCIDCDFSDWKFSSPTTETLTHLAFSFLGCVRCDIKSPSAYNFAGLGIEQNACIDCVVTSPHIDGNFRATTAVPAGNAASLGISFYAGAWNVDRSAKSLLGTKGCRVIGGAIKRLTYGANLRGASHYFNGVSIVGNIIDGAIVQEQLLTDYFTGNNLAYGKTEFIDCIVERNGSRGINGVSLRSLNCSGGSYKNNGQNSGLSADARSGLAITTAEILTVTNAYLGDDQTWTDTDTCSYEPQSSVSNKINVYIRAAGRIDIGQYVKLVNATGAGDVTAKIVNIGVDDMVTLETSGATTLSSTGNLTAMAGTWSGAGTTLTGSGTSATTEIRGQTWVTNGSEYRRVVKATSNTSIIVNAAFSSPLSGATLQMLTIDVSGIASQSNGIRAFGTVSKLMLKGNVYDGNTAARTNISTPANCITGSEYFRKTVTNTTAGNQNLQTSISAGHRLVGLATNNTVEISGGGATSYDLKVVDAGSTTKETIASTIALTVNTKVTGSTTGVSMLADGNILRATFNGGTPTAGQITCEALYRVDGVPALPSV